MYNNKNKTPDKYYSEKELAFFSRITTSVTHEINNVTAIIRELAGLLDDLLYGAEQTGQVNIEKFRKISEKITYQTKRGELIIKRLNRFAHTVDIPVNTLNLPDILQDITDLCQRFAALKNIQLETQFPQENIELTSNAFLLQFAVFVCIEQSLNASDNYGSVTVSFSVNESGAHIFITGTPVKNNEQYIAGREILEYLLKKLGGKVEVTSDNTDKHTYILYIPGSIQ